MPNTAKRKYNKDQENLDELKPSGWLQESSDPGGEAYCKLCKVELRNKVYDLKIHNSSKRHKSAIDSRGLQISAAAFMRPPGNFQCI